MSTWAPDKTPRCNPEWHHPTADEVKAAQDGLDDARALLDEKAAARAAAAEAVQAFEAKLAADQPTTRAERVAVNDAYRQADHDFQWEAAWVRSLETISHGYPIGAHQGNDHTVVTP